VSDFHCIFRFSKK